MKIQLIKSYSARYLILSIVIGLVAWLVYSLVFAKALSHAEIDQLVMQATYGKDEQSLSQLKNAAQKGQVEATMAVGKSYMFKHQIQPALQYLDAAAQQGNTEAEVLLGKLYFHGDSKIVKNPEISFKYFTQAFEQKDATAAYYLGIIYKNGYAVKADIYKANQYFEFAAQHKVPNAMFMLANAYQYGEGKNIDLKRAYYWYKEAAELELPEAIQELAHIYQYGNQVIQADQTAYQQQMLEIGHSLKHPALTP